MIYISVILSGEVEEIRIVGYVKDLGLKDWGLYTFYRLAWQLR
jgi:hypothetical protein